MTDITKRTSPAPGIDSRTAQLCDYVPGLQAGATLSKGDVCYNDGGVARKAVSTVVGPTGTSRALTRFDGMVAENFISGSYGVTLYGDGAIFGYSSSMTAGADLYGSTTAGALADAMPSGVDEPIARVISATDIQIVR